MKNNEVQKVEPQKSEIHAATADADSAPTAEIQERDTIDMTRGGHTPEHPLRMPSPLTPGTHIVRDDTSDGGPLVVETDDPELSAEHTPKDPFPTERKPEIDLPIERG